MTILEQRPWSEVDLEVLDLLMERAEVEPTVETPIPQRAAARRPPLSLAQQRLWLLWRMHPHSPAYTIATGVRLIGSLDSGALKTGLSEITRRHEILQAHVEIAPDGTPGLHVPANFRFELPMADLSTLADSEQPLRIRALCREAVEKTFDLERGPLIDARLLRLSDREHIILLSLHHLVADGWSIAILVRELNVLYSAFTSGQASPLPELPIQYADFACWQREQEDLFRAQTRYWHRQLEDLPVLDLPTDRPQPSVPGSTGGTVGFTLPRALSESLKALSRSRTATPFMTLLAVFQVLLARYTGQNDIVVGTPIANRNRREIEPLIGFFVNTLVLRADLSGRPDFRGVIDRARAVSLAAFAHQDLPFERLVGELRPDRDAGRNPLFQVMFTLQNAMPDAWAMPGLTMAPLELETRVAKFDLMLAMTESPEGFAGGLEYDADLFDRSTIERMAEHFKNLAQAVVDRPDCPVVTLPLLGAAERQRLLADWSGTETAFPRHGLAALFETQVVAAPESPAIDDDETRLSYGELNVRANRLAHFLCAHGVGVEDRIAVVLDRGVDLVVSILAILKAGAAYVPLNPDDPPARLASLVADTAPRLILSHTAYQPRLPGNLAVLCLDQAVSELTEAPVDNPPPLAGADHLAYVVYTSGSTGEPKGIAVTQGAVSRLVLNTDYLTLTPADRIAQVSNSAFDALTFELFGALLTGACLVGVDRDTSLSPARFAAVLRARRISVLFLTTALFNQVARQVPTAFAPLRAVLFGGEAVDPGRVREIVEQGPPRHLLHVYGPTESTTFATWYTVEAVPLGSVTVPIGRALANTEIYVLDTHHAPVPVGVPGELCLGGAGLARGYLHRPGLTAEKFTPHPFRHGGRLYHTGDKVRFRAEGTLEFLGRFDDQVKIRGFRIEPSEIAVALGRHPAVLDAAVIAQENPPGRKYLAAYLSPVDLDVGELRTWLAERLPDYLVPAHWTCLERLPVTANGKLDRKALPLPEATVPTDSGRAPGTETERALAAVWSDVLGISQIDIDANYFHLGGDSISAIQVVSRMERAGWRLEIRDLFRHPTISSLAPHLRNTACLRKDEGPISGPVPLSPVQRWFFTSTSGPLHHFNQSALLIGREPLDRNALAAALTALFDHHDALRMKFRQTPQGIEPYQESAGQPADFRVCDLMDDPSPSALAEHADAIQGRFDLAGGPLFKAVLYRRRDGDRLLLVAHHLVVDGVSWRILLEDLEQAYRQALSDKSVNLGGKTTSFKRWVESLVDFSTHPDLLAERAYWSAAAAGQDPFPSLPPSGGRFGTTETRRVRLAADATHALLREVHGAYFTEVPEFLLAAVGAALYRWRGVRRIRLTLEGHGREPVAEGLEVTRTVGWFTSLFPFVLNAAAEDLGERIVTVKEDLRRIPRKGLGYGILTQLTPESLRGDLGHGPAPQVSFNYLGQFADAEAGSFALADEPSGSSIAADLSRHHELDLVAAVAKGRLEMAAVFDPGRLPDPEITRFLTDVRDELLRLIEHCRTREHGEKSPADFSVPPLGLAEYRALLATEGWPPASVEDLYPLSPMQEGLFFQSLYDPGSTAYFIQIGYRPRHLPDPDRFRAAWEYLCRRHAVLRTAFVHEGVPRPLQMVFKERPPEIRALDLRELPESEQEARVLDFEAADRTRGFDLKREPLIRLTVLRLGPERCHIVLSYHHLLLDGWCMGLLTRELATIDGALARDEEPILPPVQPYGDYIRWLQTRDAEPARAFWADYLAGYEQTATLPGRMRAAAPSYPLREHAFELPSGLQGLAAALGVTLNTVVQSLWGLLLSVYNDTDDVVFGAVVSGRPARLEGVETMAGLFINTIPVRQRIDPRLSFADFARAVQQSALDAEPHHHYPLVEIFGTTALGRQLFDHVLTFENFPAERSIGGTPGEPAGASLRSLHDRTHYDFDLMVVPGERITARFHYNGELFPDTFMAEVADRLEGLARRALLGPEQSLDALGALPAADWQRVIVDFNATVAPASRYRTVVDWFEERVAQSPTALALVFGDRRLDYRGLNEWSNRLAHGLRERFVLEPEDRVGLLMDRSDRLVAAILGILKAGAAYVPIDPGLPPARMRYLVEDSGARLVLCDSLYLERLPEGCGVVADTVTTDRIDNPVPGAAPEHLAYIIYTSGSTGQPKGCQLEHRNLIHYLDWADRFYFGGDRGGCFGLYSPLSFDLTVTSLFLPLLRGKTLQVFPQHAGLDEVLAESLSPDSSIDSLKLTPAHISLLPELRLTSTGIRLAVVGGETLTREQVSCLQSLNPEMAIYNEYGPTETAVGCIVKRVTPEDASILIGRPIANTHIYIVDRRLRPVPVGVPGEILIGGGGVCRGYRNRPALNAEKFIDSPFRAGERLYRTGDMGRWQANGEIDFLGRRDHQIKIRGHRIEPGEIEHHLRRHPNVREALVLARNGELVAYVTGITGTALPAAELRSHLARHLPDYMIPSYFLTLAHLPVTRNGKVDREALPEPTTRDPAAGSAYDAPRNAREEHLAEIWAEVLGVDRVGIHDDFFALGGHSLKAMQIVSRIHRDLSVKLPIRSLFEHPSIAALAPLIEAFTTTGYAAIPPAPSGDDYPLSHAQQRLWLLHRLPDIGAAYNMHRALLFEEGLDANVLRGALSALVARHESLRTGFFERAGEPRQRIHPDLAFDLQEADLSDDSDAEVQARQIADRMARTPFDLESPPLLRALLVRLPGGRQLFLLVLHHIIADGWSMTVLYTELLVLYRALERGAADPLPPMRIQYKDFACWQLRRDTAEDERYWLSQLAGMRQGINLPYDTPPAEPRDFCGSVEHLMLTAEAAVLGRLARNRRISLAHVMLALFTLVLFRLTRQTDLCIGVSVANRNHPDLENLLGFFVNLLPVRIRVAETMEFDEMLAQVVDQAQAAFEHQDYPFDLLVQKLNPTRVGNQQPLVNVVYGFQNFTDIRVGTDIPLSGLGMHASEYPLTATTAKFDLTLFVEEVDEGLECHLEYDSGLFKPATARRILDLLRRFAQMLADAEENHAAQ